MWLTALIIGFAGSLHCLGMCSPLVLVVTNIKPAALYNRVIYNTGRIATYALLGAAVSGMGMAFPLYKLQSILSIASGIAMLAIAFGGLRRLTVPGLTTASNELSRRLKSFFARQLTRKTRMSIFMLGALNGFLPCGLTLIALAWCLTLKGPADGLNFMLLFGVGTLPVMLGFTALLPRLVKKLNWSLSGLTTYMLILSGCTLIARAFILRAPYAIADERNLMDIVLCW